MTKKLLNDLLECIRKGIHGKRWLYWPPGPMMGQVFDKDCCIADIEAILNKYEIREKEK